MFSFNRWALCSVLVVALAGCTDGIVSKGPWGSLSTNLIIAPGVDINEINYEITEQGFDPITGTLLVTSNPLEATVAGIPEGTNLTIKLFTSPGASASCSGSAMFDVVVGQTTTVQVLIQCQGTSQRGTVSVDGTVMLCPVLTAVVISPSQAKVGGTVQLSATANDFGQGALTYQWTATAGTIENASATKTTYTCSVSGTQTVSIKASNANGCYDSLSVDVICAGGTSPACGNNVVDSGETCDTAITSGSGVCPTSCDDGNSCTTDTLKNAGTCQAICANSLITQCKGGDGCCPDGCGIGNDTDCSAKCGDGVVTAPETCDPPTTCLVSCDDGDACTTDTKTGSAANCNVACTHQTIAACVSGDGCCPKGCSFSNDNDCTDTCGNGVLDTDETCDTAITSGTGVCPKSCTAPNACTTSVLQGSACKAKCVDTPITPCCGNSIIETGEQCDPPNGTTCSNTCQPCADLTGTWITRITTLTSFTAPNLLGTLSDATVDFVLRMVVTKSGSNLNTRFDICSLSTTTPSTSATPVSIAYSSAVLATLTASGSTQNVCSSVNGPVTFPTFTINTGWGGPPAPTTNTCPFPANGVTSCSGAVDSDNDGVYGITLPITYNGLITVNVYAGLTFNVALNGITLTNATTISGGIDFTGVGYLYNSALAQVSDNISITPNANPIAMSAIKLTGDVPCTTVLQQHCTGATCVP